MQLQKVDFDLKKKKRKKSKQNTERQTIDGVPAGRAGIPPSSTRECRNAMITKGWGVVGEQVCCRPPPGTSPPPLGPQREGRMMMGQGGAGDGCRGKEGQSLAH